jgi:hypothetical protein
VRLLSGYEIVFNGTAQPPRSFKWSATHFYPILKAPGDQSNASREDSVSSILAKLSIQATVRITVPMRTSDFETECVRYSWVRSISQAKAKPRVLSDV